jgi:hypothetical protein
MPALENTALRMHVWFQDSLLPSCSVFCLDIVHACCGLYACEMNGRTRYKFTHTADVRDANTPQGTCMRDINLRIKDICMLQTARTHEEISHDKTGAPALGGKH